MPDLHPGRALAAVAVLALAACKVDVAPPRGAQLSCASDADCPQGWACRASLGRCLPSGADEVPPAVVAGSVVLAHERCGPHQPVEVTFTVSEALAVAPRVRVSAPADPPPALALTAQSGLTYTFGYTPESEAAAPSGNWPIIVDLVDATGNPATGVSLASVTIDHAPPAAVAPGEQLTPDAANLLPRVDAVRDGGEYAVFFSTTEALAQAPSVVARCAGGDVPLVREPGQTAPTFFTYGLALDPSVQAADGTCPIVVSLVDLAANPGGEVTLPGVALVVDRTPPDADGSMQLATLKQLRVPWGAQQTGGAPGQFLTLASLAAGADPTTVPLPASTFAAAGEAIVQVRVHSRQAGGLLLGTLQPGAGGWTVENLGNDSPRMWLSVVDAAGNESARRAVPRVEWIAGLGGKVAGSTFENPTTLWRSESVRAVYAQDYSRTVEPAAAELSAVLAAGGAKASQPGQGKWRRLDISPTDLAVKPLWPSTFDGVLGRTLVYDGDKKQLWAHDGADNQWTALGTGGLRPGSEQGAVLAVDTKHARALLFGGRVGGGYDPETWEWDLLEGRWLKRTPAAGPPAPDTRDGSVAVFDSRRGKVLMFGGYYYGDHDDLWEWDSGDGTWTQVPKAGAWPAPRQQHVMTFDDARGVLVLFGGYAYDGGKPCPAGSVAAGGICAFGDTWEYDPAAAQWTLKVAGGAAGAPTARYQAAMAYDRLRGRAAMFGGYANTTGTSYAYVNELWEYANGAWSLRTLANPPGARFMHSVAYDWTRSRLLVLGGYSGGGATDKWMLDSAAGRWKPIARAATTPVYREPEGMFTDAVRGGVLMYGGMQTNGLYNDVWRLDLELMNWSLLEAAGTGAGFPPTSPQGCAKCNGDSTYDPNRDRIVHLTQSGQIWEYDVAGSAWVNRGTGTGAVPWPRDAAAVAFDTQRNVLVAYGGWKYNVSSCADGSPTVPAGCTSGCECTYRDLREWSPATGAWTLRSAATGPPIGRRDHRLVYDPVRKQTLVVGGYEYGLGYASDTWAWDGTAGTFTSQDDKDQNPSSRFRHSVTFDESRDVAVVFSGAPYWQLGEWDPAGKAWTFRLPLGDQPEEDWFQGIGYDRTTKQLTAFFGNGYSTSGHWTYDDGAAARPAFLYEVPVAFSALAGPSALEVAVSAGGRGYEGRTAVDGYEVWGWTPAGWAVLGSAADPPASPTPRTFAITDPVVLQQLSFGSGASLVVAVVPKRPNGQSAAMAEVVLDWVEVRARFQP
ncbi:MAG: hypothetical protein QM704_22340 [Anaeromyxobacteraceae bacterium]